MIIKYPRTIADVVLISVPGTRPRRDVIDKVSISLLADCHTLSSHLIVMCCILYACLLLVYASYSASPSLSAACRTLSSSADWCTLYPLIRYTLRKGFFFLVFWFTVSIL